MQYREGEEFQPEGSKCTKCSCVVSPAVQTLRMILWVIAASSHFTFLLPSALSVSSPSPLSRNLSFSMGGTKGRLFHQRKSSQPLCRWCSGLGDAVFCSVFSSIPHLDPMGSSCSFRPHCITNSVCSGCPVSPGGHPHPQWKIGAVKSKEERLIFFHITSFWKTMDYLFRESEELLADVEF